MTVKIVERKASHKILSCLSPQIVSKRAFFLETSVIVSLAATAALVGFLSFYILTYQEKTLYESQFKVVATEALENVQRGIERATNGAFAIAKIYAHAFPDAAQWPNVTFQPYPEIIGQINEVTGFFGTAIAPLVIPDQAVGFEAFIYDVFENDRERYPVGTGVHSFGKGIFKFDTLNGAPPDFRVHDVDGETSWGSNFRVMAPLIDIASSYRGPETSPILLNLHSFPSIGSFVDKIIECANERAIVDDRTIQCGFISEVAYSDPRGLINTDPDFAILQPIYPANNRTVLVGVTSTISKWSTVLGDVVADGVAELTAVVQTDGIDYSYRIDGGKVTYLGQGDFHESGLTSYAQRRPVDTSAITSSSSTQYTITFYPTQSYIESYRTDLPIYVSSAGVGIIFLTSAIFALFDYFTRMDSTAKVTEMDLKRQFVRFISHEVRTPLNAVAMGLQLLDEELRKLRRLIVLDGDLSSSIRDGMEAIDALVGGWDTLLKDVRSGADSAALVLDDLLFYDAISFQSMQMQEAHVPVWRLLRQELLSFESLAQQCGVDLKVDLMVDEMADLEHQHASSSVKSAGIEEQLERDRERSGAKAQERYGRKERDSRKSGIENLVFLGDAVRIGQVVKALMGNALKYSPEGSRVITKAVWIPDEDSATQPLDPTLPPAAPIAFRWRPAAVRRRSVELGSGDATIAHHGTVRLSVQDAGNGMSAEELKKIRKEGIRFKIENLNVGESIALNQEVAAMIVQRHHGTMSVESEGPGKGSTFIVELPVYMKSAASFPSYSHLASPRFPSDDADNHKLSISYRNSEHSRYTSINKVDTRGRSACAVDGEEEPGSANRIIRPQSAQRKRGGVRASGHAVLPIEENFEPDLETGQLERAAATCALSHNKDNTTGSAYSGSDSNALFMPQASSIVNSAGIGAGGFPAPAAAAPAAINDDVSGNIEISRELALPAVLVVDDIALSRKMLMRLLRSLGFECIEARDGQEALDIFFAQPDPVNHNNIDYKRAAFQMICMDFEMPVMNGPTATKLLRERGCDCLIVGVTGNVLPADVTHFLEQGANEVLAKPLNINRLMDVWNSRRGELCAKMTSTDNDTYITSSSLTAAVAVSKEKKDGESTFDIEEESMTDIGKGKTRKGERYEHEEEEEEEEGKLEFHVPRFQHTRGQMARKERSMVSPSSAVMEFEPLYLRASSKFDPEVGAAVSASAKSPDS